MGNTILIEMNEVSVMTTINVKDVSEGDVLSPFGGKALGDRILKENENFPVTLDFKDSGSHTSLFFNAMFSVLKGIDDSSIINDIKLINETDLDVDTYRRSRDTFLDKKESTDSHDKL